jgi:DNA-binding MarR family transcriptional regulator
MVTASTSTQSTAPETQELPSCEADSAALLDALTRVFRLVYYRAANTPEMLDLPIAQIRCLNALGDREGDRLVDLAARTSLTLPAASRTVDKLVRRGLVLRQTDPNDRRAVRICLSETGRDLLERVRMVRLTHIDDAICNLSPQQVAEVLRSLTLLADSASANQSASPNASL